MKLSDIRLVTEEEQPNPQGRTHLIKDVDLSAYSLYLTLRGLFGKPNGGFDETKSQWSYELKVPGAVLEVYDWKIESCSIGIYVDSEDLDDAQRIGKEFIEFIKKQCAKHNSHIKEAVNKTNSFILQNPFSLYYSSATNIMEEIDNILSAELDLNINPFKQQQKVTDLCRSAFFLFIASFEGLLNLIYELYLRPELRDERIYDRLSREQIDIKVRLAPIYCSCFKSELIDSESDVFKKFHSVANLRNDFIHANLTRAMRTPIIKEDDHIFLLSSVVRDKYGLPKNIGDLWAQDLAIVEQSIDEMIELLTQEMKPRFRKEFKSIMDKKYVQIEVEDGEIVIIGGEDY